MRRILFAAVIMIMAAFSAVAADSNLLGGAFEDAGAGARPVSLGGAFTALADDANASWWNPAGLALFGKEKSVSFTYVPDMYKLSTGSISDFVVSYGQGDTDGYGAVGGTISYRNISFGSDYTGDYEYTWTEYIIALSWGMQVDRYLGMIKYKYPKIAVGINAKYTGVSNDFEVGGTSNNAGGFSADAGVMIAFKENLNVGISGKNLYSQVNWETGESERIPYSINGGAYYGLTADFKLVVEIKATEGDTGAPVLECYCGGAEYNIDFGKNSQVQNAALRAGVTMDAANDSYIIAGGAGIAMEGFSVDYAYQYYINSELNTDTHRIGVTVFF